MSACSGPRSRPSRVMGRTSATRPQVASAGRSERDHLLEPRNSRPEQGALVLLAIAANLAAFAPAFDEGVPFVLLYGVVAFLPLPLLFQRTERSFRLGASIMAATLIAVGALFFLVGGLGVVPGALVLLAACVMPPVVRTGARAPYLGRILLTLLLLYAAFAIISTW